MPELPEVEVVRRGVAQWATGRRVEVTQVHDERSLRRHVGGTEDFVERLTGAVLLAPQRRGKFLWLPLESTPGVSASCLAIHLGMSGQVLINEPGDPRPKHAKVTLTLVTPGQAAREMRFIDQRIFGGMHLTQLAPSSHPCGSIPATAAHIAPDALEPVLDAEGFYALLRARRTGIKRALLDQQLISGVGNIYADEALWQAQLHYARPTETMTRREARRLLEALRVVMDAALQAGGTSFDALYVNVNGASGYFDRSLQCYGQAGRPCSRCETAGRTTVIRREPFMGRSAYFCPRCQPRPRRGRW